MENSEAEALYHKYRRGETNAEETAWIESWYIAEGNKAKLLNETLDYKEIEDRIWAKIQKQPLSKTKRLWPRVAAAAAIIIAIGTGIWFIQHKPVETAATYVNDVAPGKNRATITLADGKVINLSDAKSGVVIGDELKYNDGTNVNSSSLPARGISPRGGERRNMMLTASTPRGGTYQVILPDGTKVWLNADSRISFPSQFTGDKRKIVLSGEAYFEVAAVYGPALPARRISPQRGERVPFVVNTKNLEIKVLGTHFNVNSYAYEDAVRTTLVEGSVQVTPLQEPERKTILKPGQQAVASKQFLKIVPVDVEVATAWKNGKFLFREEKLESILNRIAYWYDVEIVYQGKKPNTLMSGVIERKRKLSSILQMIEISTKVKFKIEGRKVYVMN